MLLSCLFVYNNVIGYVGGTGAISDCLLKNVLILFRSTVHSETRHLVTIECITSWKCCDIARPLLNFNWMKPHVHVKLGENRATIHFLLCLIHRRNPKFLPLHCLIGMPYVNAYMGIILVWLRSYHSWAVPSCFAWTLSKMSRFRSSSISL